MRAGGKVARRILFTLLLAAIFVSSSGCALGILAAGAGVGAYVYATGDVERTYPCPIDLAWDATMGSLAELEVDIVSAHKDQLSGRVEAHTAARDTIRIDLTGQGQVTSISVRVNTFGNSKLSAVVLGRIERRLNGPPVQPQSMRPPQAVYRASAG
jgi:hypothetical protein